MLITALTTQRKVSLLPLLGDLIDIKRRAENQKTAPANTGALQKQLQQRHGLSHSITQKPVMA